VVGGVDWWLLRAGILTRRWRRVAAETRGCAVQSIPMRTLIQSVSFELDGSGFFRTAASEPVFLFERKSEPVLG